MDVVDYLVTRTRSVGAVVAPAKPTACSDQLNKAANADDEHDDGDEDGNGDNDDDDQDDDDGDDDVDGDDDDDHACCSYYYPFLSHTRP